MNVYLIAAELIEEKRDVYSCVAIDRVSYGTSLGNKPVSKEALTYGEIFSPDPTHTRGFWLSGEFMSKDGDGANAVARREWRLTALCFAAAMHDTGDL